MVRAGHVGVVSCGVTSTSSLSFCRKMKSFTHKGHSFLYAFTGNISSVTVFHILSFIWYSGSETLESIQGPGLHWSGGVLHWASVNDTEKALIRSQFSLVVEEHQLTWLQRLQLS